jgi:hypothetical protein
MKISDKVHCVFCGGKCFYRYGMSEYDIWQRQDCRTGCVWPLPAPHVLKEYYDGFSRRFGTDWVPVVESSAEKLFSHLQLHAEQNLKMLDIRRRGRVFQQGV